METLNNTILDTMLKSFSGKENTKINKTIKRINKLKYVPIVNNIWMTKDDFGGFLLSTIIVLIFDGYSVFIIKQILMENKHSFSSYFPIAIASIIPIIINIAFSWFSEWKIEEIKSDTLKVPLSK